MAGNKTGRNVLGSRGEGADVSQERHLQVATATADLITQLSLGSGGHQRIFN